MKYTLTHCNVLDGTENMEVQKDRTIVIEDNRIIDIRQGKTSIKDAVEIDVNGRFVLPGLINLHAHLAGNGKPKRAKGVSSISTLVEKYSFMQKGIQETVRNHLQTQLYSGVTTIRSLGEIGHADLACRNQIRNNDYIGPRLLVAGYGVTGIKGHMAGSMAKECASTDQSIERVEKESRSGVDWIKLFVTGGIMDAVSKDEPTIVKMPLEMAKAVCEKAHELGHKVASHAQSIEGVRISLQAGVDTIEHGTAMDEEIIALYKQNKAAMIATFSPAVAIAYLSIRETKMTKLQQEASLYLLKNVVKGVEQALLHKIPVGLGTDSSCPYVTQYDMWREIYYFWKYCKVSEAFAIHTATLKNAEILGMDQEIGSIEVGKKADLIVVKENPLEAIEHLRHVDMVMIDGKLITEPKIKYIKVIDKKLDDLM